MASISRALARIKEDLRPFLPDAAVVGACEAAGHEWRERVLGPVQTVHLLVLQVLHLNTAITGLRRLAKFAFCPAAYCEARKRLPVAALQSMLRCSSAALRSAARGAPAPAPAPAPAGESGLWRGLRAFLVD